MHKFYQNFADKYNYLVYIGGNHVFYVDNNQKAIFETSFDFPLILNETYLKDKPLGFTNWHWHEEMQFELILEGPVVMTLLGKDHTLHPGDGIFINANVEHMTRPVTPDVGHYLCLNILPSVLTLFRGSVIEQKYYLPYAKSPQLQVVPMHRSVEDDQPLLKEIDELFHTLREAGFGYELDAYDHLLHLWKLLILRTKPAFDPAEQSGRHEAREILSYLHAHYSERLTLDELASKVHISKSECCRMFRTAYGCSIFTYLSDYRLQKSIALLSDTQLSVLEISDLCGFNSTSYFIKTFREKVGQTPLQYRRSRQNAT